MFSIKQEVGGGRRIKKMENKFTGGKYYFQSNKWWVEAMAPTHLAQSRTEAPGQLHPTIVIVFIIIVVIVITIVNVILISKSMEIASGVVLF